MRPTWRTWSPQQVRRFVESWNAGLERAAMVERYGRKYAVVAGQMRAAGLELRQRTAGGQAISFAQVRAPEHAEAKWKGRAMRHFFAR